MGEIEYDLSDDTPSRAGTKSVAKLNKVMKKLGGPMNIDELKMNKELLKAIHEAKKMDKERSQASKSP